MQRVRAGSRYHFDPCALDLLHPCSSANSGDVVQVVKLHGCPPPNTMGQCHIQSLAGKFLGMVSTTSLSPVTSGQAAA